MCTLTFNPNDIIGCGEDITGRKVRAYGHDWIVEGRSPDGDWVIYRFEFRDGDRNQVQRWIPSDGGSAELLPSDDEMVGASVYVDASIWPYGRMRMCHMVADRVADLHAMAAKIGVARRWFQNDDYPHYDICKAMRAKAVKLGAKEINREEFVKIAHRLQSTHSPK